MLRKIIRCLIVNKATVQIFAFCISGELESGSSGIESYLVNPLNKEQEVSNSLQIGVGCSQNILNYAMTLYCSFDSHTVIDKLIAAHIIETSFVFYVILSPLTFHKIQDWFLSSAVKIKCNYVY